MTLKQLKYLLGVVDNGLNITAAAERLYTSQPGISKQIRLLEEEVGVCLFARRGKSLTGLTAAGRLVVDHARTVTRNVDNIRSLGQELVAEQEGTLAIATTHTQARYVLPAVIQQFHQRFPKVNLELHQGTSEQIAALVAEGGIDCVIATGARELFPNLNQLPCYCWDRIVLTPADHALAADPDALTLARLAEHPLITYVFSSRRESSFLNAFANQGLNPTVVFTARDADVIKTYVRIGMGVGVIAPMALQGSDLQDFHVRSAAGLFPRVTTWLGVPRDRVLRGYNRAFIGLFAPHWPMAQIDAAAGAQSQAQIDELASKITLPLHDAGGDTARVTPLPLPHISTAAG